MYLYIYIYIYRYRTWFVEHQSLHAELQVCLNPLASMITFNVRMFFQALSSIFAVGCFWPLHPISANRTICYLGGAQWVSYGCCLHPDNQRLPHIIFILVGGILPPVFSSKVSLFVVWTLVRCLISILHFLPKQCWPLLLSMIFRCSLWFTESFQWSLCLQHGLKGKHCRKTEENP